MEARAFPSNEFEIIERITRIVSNVRDAKSDYTYLAAELEQAVSFDVFGVVLLHHDRKALRITTCERGDNGAWRTRYHQRPFGESRLRDLLETRELVVQEYPDGLDGPPSTCGDALSSYPQLHSTLIVPLIAGEHMLGSLELGSVEKQAYASPRVQRLLSVVAQVLATTIESVQLGGSAAIQDRQREALKNVTSALTGKMDLEVILEKVVTGISDALNVPSCICLRDRSDNYLRLAAQAGLAPESLEIVFKSGLLISEQCILGSTLLRRQSFVSNDIAQDSRFPVSQVLYRECGVRSILSYPLTTGATIYGVLFLCSQEAGGFTPLKADILALFANQATIAIHNGILLDSVHQRRRFQQALEQLEQKQQQKENGRKKGKISQEELSLLERVREETQKTFGVSFLSFLRFISDYLLTPDERDIQDHIPRVPAAPLAKLGDFFQQARAYDAGSQDLEAQKQDEETPYGQTLSLLAQTAGDALTRAGGVGELGRLLMELKQTTRSLHDSWFVIDLDGICTYMNPVAESFCGLDRESMPLAYGKQSQPALLERRQGTPLKIEDVFASLFPRMRNAQEVLSYLKEFSQRRDSRRTIRCDMAAEPLTVVSPSMPGSNKEWEIHVEDTAEDYYYQMICYPLHGPQGQLASYALQIQDITKRLRDEKNRSALLSSVSHDLRTPLTTIKIAVTGLLENDACWDAQDRAEFLEDINRETDHLTVQVTAWVELARIEMGALVLEKEWCDVVEIFFGSLKKVQSSVDEFHVNEHIEEALPFVFADHAQLERVFFHLIVNAIQHSPPDAPVDVYIETVMDGTKMLQVRVIDHGEGVPESEREHIFKSFYRSETYGNGMGLAICRGIVEAHQGKIWLDENHKPGACFGLSLPIHTYASVPSPERPGEDRLGNQDRSEIGGLVEGERPWKPPVQSYTEEEAEQL